MIEELKPLIGKLSIFAKDRMGFSHPPKLFIKQNKDNANKMLGRTAHYDPSNESVTLYVTARHPKDILRSYAHELVHHAQNLRGDLTPDRLGPMGKNYAQDNDHMRNMEKEAYLQGNMCFRDFEDTLGDKDIYTIKIAESKFLKENRKVNANKLTELIRGIVKEKLQEGPKLISKDSKEYKDAKSFIDSVTIAWNNRAEEDKDMPIKPWAVQKMFPGQPEQMTRMSNAFALLKKVKEPQNFNFSSDPVVNKFANLAYQSLSFGRQTLAQMEQQREAYLQRALQGGVTGDLINGLDASGAAGNADLGDDGALPNKRVQDAQRAAGIDAAITSFTSAGDKIFRATKVKLKAATPAPAAPETPEAPSAPETDVDTDTAIASTTPVVPQAQMGGVAEPPPAPVGTPVGAAAASAGGGKSRKARQQNTIVNRGDMADMGIEDIGMLQQRLVDAGYASYTLKGGGNFVDGDFGPATIRAVRKLQRDLGFRYRDGVIGKNTIAKIKASNKPKVKIFRMGPAAASADRGMARRPRRSFQENKTVSRKITKSLLREIIEKQLEAFEYETQSESAVPPPHPYDIEDGHAGSMGPKPQAGAAPVQDVLKMISDISSDGKITGEELMAAGKKLMQQSGGSSYRDSQEFRDDYAANQDQLDDLAAYQNMEEGSEELEEIVGKNISKLKGGLKNYMEKQAEKKKKTDKKEPAGKTSQDAPMSVPADDNDPPAKDSNKGESAKGAAKDAEKAEKNESKIQTPEQENFLYESRFTGRNTRIYEQLVKNWTK